MHRPGFFVPHVLLVLGVAFTTDASFDCHPHIQTSTQDVTYTSVVTVTSLLRSLYPYDGGKQDVTLTETKIVWATATTTVGQNQPPPVVFTGTSFLTSTVLVTTAHVVQVLCFIKVSSLLYYLII